MGSRALISSLIAISFFAGAMTFVALRPLGVPSPEGDLALSAAKFLNEQEPGRRIVRSGRIRNHQSNLMGLMVFTPGSAPDRRNDGKNGLLGPVLEGKLSSLPDLGLDGKLKKRFGNSEEAGFIRFGIALQLNDFETMATRQERQEMEEEYARRLRNADAPVFQNMKISVLEVLSGDDSKAERLAVLRIMASAAVENDYARMMIQDLVLQDFYRNPDQDFSRVAARYEIGPGHPLYGKLMKSFNRAPASGVAK